MLIERNMIDIADECQGNNTLMSLQDRLVALIRTSSLLLLEANMLHFERGELQAERGILGMPVVQSIGLPRTLVADIGLTTMALDYRDICRRTPLHQMATLANSTLTRGEDQSILTFHQPTIILLIPSNYHPTHTTLQGAYLITLLPPMGTAKNSDLAIVNIRLNQTIRIIPLMYHINIPTTLSKRRLTIRGIPTEDLIPLPPDT